MTAEWTDVQAAAHELGYEAGYAAAIHDARVPGSRAHHEIAGEHELVSAREVAGILGVRPSTVRSYLARKQMPEPYVTLACGPIWLRSEVERWARFERRSSTGSLTPE